MTNAELIYNLRYCFEKRKTVVGVPWYVWCDRAADALEAAEKRIKELESQAAFFDAEKLNYQENIEYRDEQIKELEDDLRNGTIRNIDRYKVGDYTVRDLILFAEMCKRNDVQESDLKQAAWNLELAVRAVMNERAEIVKNMADEITMRFTPDFEKAYAEMMGKEKDDGTLD